VLYTNICQKFDYCSAILHGSPKSSTIFPEWIFLTRILLVHLCGMFLQSCLARVVLQQSKYRNATQLLKSLRWLPVQQRIPFKLAVVTYKVKSTKMPAYLHTLLSERVPTRTLKSSSRPFLDVTRIKSLCGQQAALHISASNTWNSLPVMDIRLACSVTISKKCLYQTMLILEYIMRVMKFESVRCPE